jgi:hypothetical protein
VTARTFTAVCGLALLSLVACRREPPAPETRAAAAQAQTTTVAGAPRDLAAADIEVTIPLRPNVVTRCVAGTGGKEKTAFAAGEPIELMLALAEAPPELKVAARLVGESEEIVAHVSEPAAGKTAVTIAIRQAVEPGSYRLEGYWGGNLVCEHRITVE